MIGLQELPDTGAPVIYLFSLMENAAVIFREEFGTFRFLNI